MDFVTLIQVSRRLTVIGSRRRVDAVLPDAVPVGELMPDLLDMLGEGADGAAVDWCLVRVGGHVLDPEATLSAQGVGDGVMLFLQDLAAAPPEPAIEDYAEQVAVAVDLQPGRWSGARMPAFLVAAAAVAALAGGVIATAAGDSGSRVVVGGAGAIAIAGAGLALTAVRRAHTMAVWLLFAGLAYWASAAVGLAGFGHANQVATVAAAAGALTLGSLVALVIAGDAATTPAAGVVSATLIPAVAAAGSAILGGTLLSAVAVAVPVELAAVALAAPAAVSLLGIAASDTQALAGRLHRGRHLVAALLAGGAFVIAASSVLLALQGGWPARVLVVAAGIGVAIRARHFRFAAEVVPLLSAALVSLAALQYPLAARLAISPRGIGDLAALLTVDVLVLVAAATAVQAWHVSARVNRWLGPLEFAAIAASVPLALGAIGAFDAAARFARGLG